MATAVIELAALELLLRVRHHVAANVFLGVDALALLWILGYSRSVQLRPNKGTPGYLRAPASPWTIRALSHLLSRRRQRKVAPWRVTLV